MSNFRRRDEKGRLLPEPTDAERGAALAEAVSLAIVHWGDEDALEELTEALTRYECG